MVVPGVRERSLSQTFPKERIAVAQVSPGETTCAFWLCHGVGSALPPVPPGSAAWPLAA